MIYLHFFNTFSSQQKWVCYVFLREINPVTTNLDIPGYTFEHTLTKSSLGGTIMYIPKDIFYVLRNDLQIYSPKELGSIVVEIITLNKPSLILGTIYKHPSMKPYKLNNGFLESLLSEFKAEGKAAFLAGDFNFNVRKNNQYKITAEFLGHLFANSFNLQVILPTRSTSASQTLIDNIFLNNQSYRSVSGNRCISISDHVTQIGVLKHCMKLCDIISKVKFTYTNFKNFEEKCFTEELKSIDWSVATEYSDLDLGFKSFFHLFNKTLDKHAPQNKNVNRG